jgi:hypothetical protein
MSAEADNNYQVYNVFNFRDRKLKDISNQLNKTQSSLPGIIKDWKEQAIFFLLRLGIEDIIYLGTTRGEHTR